MRNYVNFPQNNLFYSHTFLTQIGKKWQKTAKYHKIDF
ncbi:hypothetical protein ACVW0P_004351 [Mucilaginibacter sp. UYNi724]